MCPGMNILADNFGMKCGGSHLFKTRKLKHMGRFFVCRYNKHGKGSTFSNILLLKIIDVLDLLHVTCPRIPFLILKEFINLNPCGFIYICSLYKQVTAIPLSCHLEEPFDRLCDGEQEKPQKRDLHILAR